MCCTLRDAKKYAIFDRIRSIDWETHPQIHTLAQEKDKTKQEQIKQIKKTSHRRRRLNSQRVFCMMYMIYNSIQEYFLPLNWGRLRLHGHLHCDINWSWIAYINLQSFDFFPFFVCVSVLHFFPIFRRRNDVVFVRKARDGDWKWIFFMFWGARIPKKITYTTSLYVRLDDITGQKSCSDFLVDSNSGTPSRSPREIH